MEVSGRTAVVAGASRGIGRAIATALAVQGAAVTVGYHHRRDAADAVVAEIEAAGGRARAVGGDLTEEKASLGLFDRSTDLGQVSARRAICTLQADARSRTTESTIGAPSVTALHAYLLR